MFRSELTGETSGPHPRPDLEHTGGSTGAESLHSRNLFILTEMDRGTQHGVSGRVCDMEGAVIHAGAPNNRRIAGYGGSSEAR